MGIASSEVEIKTAISVPAPIILLENRFDAAMENPHCGTQPRAAPTAAPPMFE